MERKRQGLVHQGYSQDDGFHRSRWQAVFVRRFPCEFVQVVRKLVFRQLDADEHPLCPE